MNIWKTNRQFLTGSLPSMASSHNLLLDSDCACSVITPCLETLQRKAALSLISLPWAPWTDLVYIGWDHYKRTCVTKIAHVQMLDFKLCPRLARCITFHSQLKCYMCLILEWFVHFFLHPTCFRWSTLVPYISPQVLHTDSIALKLLWVLSHRM